MGEDADAVLNEAIGSDLPLRPAAAVIVMGVLALLIVGLAPALLGALVDEHRITDADLGLVAMLELLTMGVCTGLAGAFMKPERLRVVGAGAILLLAASNVATFHAAGIGVFLMRFLAGIPEGLLLWITVGMIARSKTPERWAGVFFLGQVVAQLALAVAFASVVIPAFGADGGFAAIGLTCLISLPAAFFLPQRYGPLLQAKGVSGAPPPRGLIALFATVVFMGGNGAVSVYLQPLAHLAGLSADVARTALWTGLVAQICGATLATALAGRVRYFTVFSLVVIGFLAVWLLYGLHVGAIAFVGATALAGLVQILVSPFLVPMTIQADPSRRAAMQSAGAQLLGGAGGPLLAFFVVGDANVIGVLWLGAALLLAGFSVIAWLHFTSPEAATAS